MLISLAVENVVLSFSGPCIFFESQVKPREQATVMSIKENLYSHQNQAFNEEPNTQKSNVTCPSPSFQLLWKNVSREIDVRLGIFPFNTTSRRSILNPMNGFVDAGSITALMGPSGAGKTTLLKIIANKISSKVEGVTGEVVIRHNMSPKEAKSFRIGYVPQNDSLFTEFTVKEILMFSSRMINGHLSADQHKDSVDAVMRKLDLFDSQDTPVKRLSGGQMKRTSIGTELMGQPRVLILDEPTSGLDSDTSEKVMDILKNMAHTQNKSSVSTDVAPAILATIHQPSRDIFYLFDNIFLLSRAGHNIYYGSPENVFDFLKSFGYSSSRNTNPAEFMIEFANGRQGMADFSKMSIQTFGKTRGLCMENKHRLTKQIEVKKLHMRTSTSFVTQVWLLFSRQVTRQTMKLHFTPLKMLLGFLIMNMYFNISKIPFGESDGCWESVKILDKDSNGNLNLNFLGLVAHTKKTIVFPFMTVLYELLFYAFAMAFIMPLELPTYMKEMSNSWYSPLVFTISHFLANSFHHLLAFLLTFTFSYWVSNQAMDTLARPIFAFLILFIFGIANESKGELICLIFNKSDNMIPMIISVGVTLPLAFLAGFLVRVNEMVEFMQPIARLNDVTNAFEAMLIVIFGMDRCKPINDTNFLVLPTDISFQRFAESIWSNVKDTDLGIQTLSVNIGLDPDYLDPVVDSANVLLNRTAITAPKQEIGNSFMLHTFDVKDQDLLWKMSIIVSYLVVVRIAVYLLLKYRVSSRND